MLSETFVVATEDSVKPTNRSTTGVHIHELQPGPKLKNTFKKSSSKSHCLAVGDNHIIAAQADKAVVHVYNRDSNKQEAVVPFPDKISSLCLAFQNSGAGSLVLGTETGRIILWELSTGRQISTPRHHLQSVSCLAVDQASNFLLSGSADFNIHVWCLPKLLSIIVPSNQFGEDITHSPVRTLSSHRGAVTDVVYGHIGRQNVIAVSVARDDKCIVWNPSQGSLLHTFLLSSTPLCLALDPADRAAFVGFADGAVQCINFYEKQSLMHPFSDQNGHHSTQASDTSRWTQPKDDSSPTNCLAVSYDSSILLSGHENGKVCSWNVGGGKQRGHLADFAAPVTNLLMLTPSGFFNTPKPPLKLHQVTKPKYESFSNSTDGSRPQGYSVRAQLVGRIQPSAYQQIPVTDDFHGTLRRATFSDDLVYASMAQLQTDQKGYSKADSEAVADLDKKNAALVKELEDARLQLRMQKVEGKRRREDAAIKAQRKKRRRERLSRLDELKRKKTMGEPADDAEMNLIEASKEEENLSSDTDELTD